jgi:hypothetical protein
MQAMKTSYYGGHDLLSISMRGASLSSQEIYVNIYSTRYPYSGGVCFSSWLLRTYMILTPSQMTANKI